MAQYNARFHPPILDDEAFGVDSGSDEGYGCGLFGSVVEDGAVAERAGPFDGYSGVYMDVVHKAASADDGSAPDAGVKVQRVDVVLCLRVDFFGVNAFCAGHQHGRLRREAGVNHHFPRAGLVEHGHAHPHAAEWLTVVGYAAAVFDGGLIFDGRSGYGGADIADSDAVADRAILDAGIADAAARMAPAVEPADADVAGKLRVADKREVAAGPYAYAAPVFGHAAVPFEKAYLLRGQPGPFLVAFSRCRPGFPLLRNPVGGR